MIDLMRFCLTNDVWMRMENEKQTNTNNDDEKKTYKSFKWTLVSNILPLSDDHDV